MQCKINAPLFTKIVDSIKDLNPHANFDFTPQGLHFQVMDSAHVSLSSLSLPKDSFEEYVCEHGITLGIHLKSLLIVLKGSTGPLTMQTQGDKLTVQVAKNSGIANYSLNLMDIDSDQLSLPDITYDAVSTLPSSVFTKVMRDMTDFSDTCSICIGDSLTVTNSGDMGKAQWNSGEDCDCKAIQATEPLQFSVSYLCQFSKACAVSPTLIIGLKADTPACFTFPVKSGYLRFYLAPKIEGDE